MGTVMATTYEGILVRDSFSDRGQIPTTGDLWMSPDIIPYGNNALSIDSAVSTYSGPDIGRPVTNGENNNIYIRGKNTKKGASTGTAQLYWADPSLLLHPKQWHAIAAPGQAREVSFVGRGGAGSVGSEEICPSSPAFHWQGLPGSSTSHYCMVAVISTDGRPANIPKDFGSNAEFSRWVAENPSVAWRNVILVPGKNSFSQDVRVLNLDDSAADFLFVLVGHGIPTDNEVSVVSSDQKNPLEWRGILPRPDSRGLQSLSFTAQIPASLNSFVTVSASSTSNFSPGWYFKAYAYKLLGSSPTWLEQEMGRSLSVRSDSGAESEEQAILLGEVAFSAVG